VIGMVKAKKAFALIRFTRRRASGAPQASAFPGLFEPAVPQCEDLFFAALKPVSGRHIPDGAVKPHLAVVLHVSSDHTPGIVEGQRRLRADALALDRAVPALKLAVALRVVRKRQGQTGERGPCFGVMLCMA